MLQSASCATYFHITKDCCNALHTNAKIKKTHDMQAVLYASPISVFTCTIYSMVSLMCFVVLKLPSTTLLNKHFTL